jgi:hypothetical protein
MVRHRPDPRLPNPNELFRWQATLGPFRKTGFSYNYYKFYDFALKHPNVAMVGTVLITTGSYFAYRAYDCFNTSSYDAPMLNKTMERLYEHSQWSNDSRKIRGEWNNNFACWSDSPDCGKDFKKRYSS